MNEQPTKEWWLQNDPVKEGWGPFESEAAAWRHLFGRDPGAEDIRQHEEAGWYVGFINRWPNVMCTPSGASTELYTMTTPVPHGTIALMAFAATLPQRAENLRGFFDYNAAAADLMRCKEIIDRLAQHESDIEAEPGEN